MTDFIAEQWGNINWQTAIAAMVLFVPVAIGVFTLIAKHSRELLTSETERTKKLRAQIEEQQSEISSIRNEKMALEAAYDATKTDVLQEVVDLSAEEVSVLRAISSDRLGTLLNSGSSSKPRISLARDRLLQAGLIQKGINGYYATADGRQWLDLNGLLD